MQPAIAHRSARQGTFSVSTGTSYTPPEMTAILRKKELFSKEDLSVLGTAPPASLMSRANDHTVVFPCPDMSVEELLEHFSSATHLPTVEVTEKLRAQPWVREKGHASWMRVDPIIFTSKEHAEEGRRGNARELAIICLMLHDPWSPGNWNLWRATSSTESTDGFQIYVRMLHGRIQFHQAGRGDVSVQQTVRVRTVRASR